MKKMKRALALLLCCSMVGVMASCNANGELDINGILGALGQSSANATSSNTQSEVNNNSSTNDMDNNSNNGTSADHNDNEENNNSNNENNNENSGKPEDEEAEAPSLPEEDLTQAVGSEVTKAEWDAAFALLTPEMNVTMEWVNDYLTANYQFTKNACAGIIENGFFITEEDASYHYFQDENGNWLRDEIAESLVTHPAQLYSRIVQLAGLAYSQLTYDDVKGVYYGNNVTVMLTDGEGNELGGFLWGTISIEMRKGKVYQIITDTTELALNQVTFSKYGTTKIEKPTSYGEGKSPHAPDDFVSIN